MPHVTPLRAEDPDRVGRYRLAGRISGMPGTGPVFLATAVDGTEVTLRLLRGQWTQDAAARDRFAAEAGAAAQVPPFCTARILDADVVGDRAYLVSEYVAGRSLLETVADDGGLHDAALEALAVGSATGLASVHQAGLVHGGFGPEHVIMSAAGPRVIEYGITPPYGPATPSADMLAWAQTMVFAAVGRPPATFSDLDSLPGGLRGAVADCLAGDPAARSSARAVVLDLLDGIQPASGLLAEGSRRAAAAAPLPDGIGARSGRAHQAEPGGGASAGRDRARRDEDFRDRNDQVRGSQDQRGRDRNGRDRNGRDRYADRAAQGGRGRSGRKTKVVSAAAAVVLISVIALVFTMISRSGSSDGRTTGASQADATSSAGSGSPSATATASPRASATVTVPAAFAGSWSGLVTQQNPAIEFDVRLSLAARSARGNVAYSSGSFSCAGQLSPQTADSGTLTLDQGDGTGKHNCPHGQVTLLAESDGTLKFTFRGKTGPVATGTLTRS